MSPALAPLLLCHSLNTTSTPTRPRNNVKSTTRENMTERGRRGRKEGEEGGKEGRKERKEGRRERRRERKEGRRERRRERRRE